MEDNSSDDLFTKYQKLATQYSKMRAQITVLKKAYTDEHASNGELRDRIKEKDQSLRKFEQELESLNFRNQQLTKRVVVLQEDLTGGNNATHGTSKKSKSKQSTPTHSQTHNDSHNSIDNNMIELLNMELNNKISENEKLHIKLHTSEMNYMSQIDDMQKLVDAVKEQYASKEKELLESIESQQSAISKLNGDKLKLESKLQICQKELQETKLLVDNYVKHSTLQSPSTSEDKMSVTSNAVSDDETVYLRNKIAQLCDNLHISDSKTVAFHSECVALQQRLAIAESDRLEYERQIDSFTKNTEQLKEELSTNVSNYESQLSVMSEHLANMNDKLTAQKDEIDSLKMNHTNKGRKLINMLNSK